MQSQVHCLGKDTSLTQESKPIFGKSVKTSFSSIFLTETVTIADDLINRLGKPRNRERPTLNFVLITVP